MLLPDEVSRIWMRRFTGASWVYFVNRYAAFFAKIMFLGQSLTWYISDEVRRLDGVELRSDADARGWLGCDRGALCPAGYS